MRRPRLTGSVCALLLVTAACTSGGEETFSGPDEGIDANAAAFESGCDAEELGDDGTVSFSVAHRVVDGELGEVCFGEPDPVLLDAWDLLVAITPPRQLGDLGLFAGFGSVEDDEVTLAFVHALDSDGSQFQMSVNLAEARSDPDQLKLTMAHEFSHVFAGLSTQLDRTVESIESCETYDNGEGCYLDDSLIWAWIEEFWGEDELAQVDPSADATGASGQRRCDDDPGFFGSYAASNPEEDFAEAFSAFVFRVPALSPEQQDRLDWIGEQPGLAEFRDRADSAGFQPIDHRFDECGLDVGGR